MDTEDEPTEGNSATDMVSEVKAGCLRSIYFILNRAERNHRQLIVEETRMLRELTTVYVMFCKMYKPKETEEQRQKEVRAKYPRWIQEELKRREAEQLARKSIT